MELTEHQYTALGKYVFAYYKRGLMPELRQLSMLIDEFTDSSLREQAIRSLKRHDD